jgi:Ca-activated chloride channel homolog
MFEVVVQNFHFLRPLWLWALVPILGLFLALQRRLDPRRAWRELIAPQLLEHLTVGAEGGARVRPVHLTTLTLVLATIAVAGPTWNQEVSPFAEDSAPLVIVLDVSRSMNAVDVQPTRLERAKQKVRDLLAERPGARTALIAYAGSAHTVLPLSSDATMFESFLDGLETSIMPVAGKQPGEALGVAVSILERDSVPGSILFMTDGIGVGYTDDFVRHAAASRDRVLVLAFGTTDGAPVRTGENQFATDAGGARVVAKLDREGLEALESQAGIFVVGATVDGADVARLQREVQSHLRVAQQDDPTARWKDNGYYLLVPIVLLALFWFRKGWTIRWSAAVIAFGLAGCNAAPGGSDSPFVDLWLTPDQQGRRLYEQQRYAEAAQRFEDFAWRAASAYRAGDMDRAILAWARVESPEAYFGLGNAYARLERYDEALAGYDQALELRPGWVEAEQNRALIESLIPPPLEEDEGGTDAGPPSNLGADEVQFDERGEGGERGLVDDELFSDEQITEMWMRRLQTSPGDFLRRRFAIENAQRGAAGDEGGPGGAERPRAGGL